MTEPSVTVAEIGERRLIERIRTKVPPLPPPVLVGIGDDAAVVEPERNTLDVITTDSLVEDVHFRRDLVPADAIGYKALAVNLSDLASMGASPRAATLSLALPDRLPVADFDDLVDGFLGLAARYGVALVGGNIARSPGPLFVDVTAIGAVRPRRVLRRDGARAGDELFVSGSVGAAAAGLVSLMYATSPGMRGTLIREAAGAKGDLEACRARFLRPDPRVRLGVLIGRNRAASACVDLSDGLADAIRQLAVASGLGATIEADAVPITGLLSRVAGDEADTLDLALRGGEDYELLFTVPPKRRRLFLAVSRLAGGLPVTRIGAMTASPGLVLRRHGREEELPEGFVHFR
jgi:thiamine-monophosphate kinase